MRNIVFRVALHLPQLRKVYEKIPNGACLRGDAPENIRIENLKFAAVQNNNYIEIASEYNQWCATETAGTRRI